MTRAWLLFRKDLRVLRRSPLLLGLLVSYPVVIALLVGLVAGYANAKPRVALVDEDNLPAVVEIAGQTFGVSKTIRQVSREVDLVRMDGDEAQRQLEAGKVVAVITVPPGFIADLRTTVQQPSLVLQTGTGGVSPRVQQQMQALVYQLNQKLQRAFIGANLRYVELILRGGDGSFLGQSFHVLGLDRTQRLLEGMQPSRRAATIREFVRVARLALRETGGALQATANPIRLVQAKDRGRSWALSAQVQAYGIALTITFLALLLAAGAAAAERDENVIGRLGRGLVSHGQLVAAKVALAAGKQGKYFEMHQKLFSEPGKADKDKGLRIAAELGLDVPQLEKDMQDPSIQQALDEAKDLAKKLGLQGTPLYLIGDRVVPGAPDDLYDQLTAKVAEVREKGCKATC